MEELQKLMAAKEKELETLKRKQVLANDAVSCNISFDTFEKTRQRSPKYFPCGHSSCLDCILKLFNSRLQHFRDNNLPSPSIEIKCPTYRYIVRIITEEPGSFLLNLCTYTVCSRCFFDEFYAKKASLERRFPREHRNVSVGCVSMCTRFYDTNTNEQTMTKNYNLITAMEASEDVTD
ncbi:unnamed protein product [Caenorhabditis brenneri]